MNEPKNGYEFLKQLKNQTGKERHSFNQFTEYLEPKARQKGVPISGQFELTPLCNFNCEMCYVHLAPEQIINQSILSVQVWKNLIYQAWKEGMIYATLTGGECLTYPGFNELYLYLHSLGCEICVLTNGFLLDDKRIQFFKEHKPHRIQVTLYGQNDDVYERTTGQRAFSTVSENIHKAVEAGIHVSVCVTPYKTLGDDILETIKIGKRIGKDFIVNPNLFTPRKETGRSRLTDNHDAEMYVRIYKLLNELNNIESIEVDRNNLPLCGGPNHECIACGLRCGGGRSSFVIDWKGTLMPCNRLDMIQAYPLKESFRKAWTKVNQESNAWPRVPECEGCPYDPVCANCAANMLEYAEPGKQPLALCERTKYFVQHGVIQISECE